MDRNPALRASDDDRARVAAALERHTTAGRLRLDEYESRLTAALGAVTLGDLDAVTHDLPDIPAEAPAPHTSPRHLVLALVLAGLTLLLLAVALAIFR